jgi:hypothetical protein
VRRFGVVAAAEDDFKPNIAGSIISATVEGKAVEAEWEAPDTTTR